MTAHRPKPVITPERLAWFRTYHAQNSEWGVFHVALADANYERGAAQNMLRPGTGCHDSTRFVPARYDFGRDEWDPDVREAADWFDKLTSSQRRRLQRKCS